MAPPSHAPRAARPALAALVLATACGGASTPAVTAPAELRPLPLGDARFCGKTGVQAGFEVTVGADLDLCCDPQDLFRVEPKSYARDVDAGAAREVVVVQCETPRHDVTVLRQSEIAAWFVPAATAIARAAIDGPSVWPGGDALEVAWLGDPVDIAVGQAASPGAVVPARGEGVQGIAPFVQRLLARFSAGDGFILRRRAARAWGALALDALPRIDEASGAVVKREVEASGQAPVLGVRLGPHLWMTMREPHLDVGSTLKAIVDGPGSGALQVGDVTYGLGAGRVAEPRAAGGPGSPDRAAR